MRSGPFIPVAFVCMLATACSANSDENNKFGEGGSSGSAASGGSGGTSDYDGSPGGSGGGLDATIPIDPDSGGWDSHPPTDGDTCSAQSVAAEPYPLDMYVMMDQSGSMISEIGVSGKSKWIAAVDAFTSFLNNTTQEGLSMGIQYFPLPVTPWGDMPACDPDAPDCGTGVCITVDTGPFCHAACTSNADCASDSECRGDTFCSNDSCDGNAYAVPEVEIQELPGASGAIIASLNAHGPTTMTPTGPAIGGGIMHAKQWATNHPDHTTIVILTTDGMPTVCPSDQTEAQQVNTVKQIAQSGVNGTPSIRTFVIGVTMAADFIAVNNLNAMAASGGTTKAFIVNPNQDMTAQFAQALEAIRGAAMPCDFKIPSTGGQLDYEAVNVVYTAPNGTDTATVYYVGDASQCDPVNGGWYYDTDPGQVAPTKIILCPQSCAFVQQYGGKIDIEMGCKTITPPK